jgi:Ca2+-binding RTX toxin-like protein
MRRSLLLLTTMALALLMASSVALALNRISCPGGYCDGTNAADSMSGTTHQDCMYGYEGNDKLNGYGNSDILYGDLGNDTLNGGDGPDVFDDYAGTNMLNGGAGADTFFADFASYGYDEISKISGGTGNDIVYAHEGTKDTINCGAGTDHVSVDQGLDVVRGCELFSP